MKRRFWIGLVLSLPVIILEMGGHLTGLHMLLGQTASNWLQLLLATPVVLWAGWPFFERGWRSLKSRNLNMFTLIAMGTGVAWAYSVIATLFPAFFPPAFQIMMVRSLSISRLPPSSPCWCYWARCSNCAPASRPRAPSAPSLISLPRRPGAFPPMAAKPMSRSIRL